MTRIPCSPNVEVIVECSSSVSTKGRSDTPRLQDNGTKGVQSSLSTENRIRRDTTFARHRSITSLVTVNHNGFRSTPVLLVSIAINLYTCVLSYSLDGGREWKELLSSATLDLIRYSEKLDSKGPSARFGSSPKMNLGVVPDP